MGNFSVTGLEDWVTPGLTAQAHRRLLGCGSLEELRLTAELMGIDHESWLRKEGFMWYPQRPPPSCDWTLQAT